jgi:hypothetical protein
MGIKWTDLSLAQKSMIEGGPVEPAFPRAQILRRPRLERDEQRLFANWCLLHALPFCWHATHKPSTATRGVFDFWVGKDSRSAWLEFKSLPVRLSKEQLEFGDALSAHKLEWHIVHSAQEAIAIVKGWS